MVEWRNINSCIQVSSRIIPIVKTAGGPLTRKLNNSAKKAQSSDADTAVNGKFSSNSSRLSGLMSPYTNEVIMNFPSHFAICASIIFARPSPVSFPTPSSPSSSLMQSFYYAPAVIRVTRAI